jgi:hypothetical protein
MAAAAAAAAVVADEVSCWRAVLNKFKWVQA